MNRSQRKGPSHALATEEGPSLLASKLSHTAIQQAIKQAKATKHLVAYSLIYFHYTTVGEEPDNFSSQSKHLVFILETHPSDPIHLSSKCTGALDDKALFSLVYNTRISSWVNLCIWNNSSIGHKYCLSLGQTAVSNPTVALLCRR